MRNTVIIAALFVLVACSSQVRKEATGFTQGTTYSVIYFNGGQDLQYQIDSLLLSFDRVLSTYQESSYISKWNRNQHSSLKQPQLFKEVLKRALNISEFSSGAFDITVSPLMKYWFENDWKVSQMDSAKVDSLMQFVGMKSVVLDGQDYEKTNPQTQLDVNAIAQGYSVDVLARYLESLGIFNYLVEIGGEVRTNGTKANEENWKVGIDVPKERSSENRELAMSVDLSNKALATSGNYRKFVEIDGVKYGHSLNPNTGYPATTDVLSATIIADDCMTADALATACMVMGFDDSKKLLLEQSDFEGVLIYSDSEGTHTWMSEGVKYNTVESTDK
ncbi:FAD:protein FMN transferase, partial [bacterium]|nr:FAD:protein FMN transferase [Flavobacteriales bacterium]MDB4678409.1 FAD:protein FMN transferase [bacterium]